MFGLTIIGTLKYYWEDKFGRKYLLPTNDIDIEKGWNKKEI